MVFSYKELETYFKNGLPGAQAVADALIEHAFEVETVIEKDGDFQLDIKVLPDRAGDAKTALGMARELSGCLNLPLKDEYLDLVTEANCRIKIDFSGGNLAAILGIDISKEDIISQLKRARVEVVKNDQVGLTALIPTERTDINIKEDLADEVIRFYGHNKLISKPLDDPKNKPASNPSFNLAFDLRLFLAKKNFVEVYDSTFVKKGVIEVEKPLASDKGFLRTDLASGMERSLELNLRHLLFDDDSVKLFEIGTVFPAKDGEEKRLCFGIAYGDPKGNKSEQETNEILSELEKIFGTDQKTFNIKKTNTSTIVEVKLDEFKEKGMDDLALEELSSFIKKNNTYHCVSIYPRIIRDVALFVSEGTKPEAVAEAIQMVAGELLVLDPVLFDEFHKEDKVSLAFRLVFQSTERTLSDEEVNSLMQKVITGLEQGTDWKVR